MILLFELTLRPDSFDLLDAIENLLEDKGIAEEMEMSLEEIIGGYLGLKETDAKIDLLNGYKREKVVEKLAEEQYG